MKKKSGRSHESGMSERSAKKDKAAKPGKNAQSAMRVAGAIAQEAAERIAASDCSPLARLVRAGTPPRGAFRPLADPPTPEPPPISPIQVNDLCVSAENVDPAYLADVLPADPNQQGRYITFNSFSYWNKYWATNPIAENEFLLTTFYAQYGAIPKQFECFFNSPLATVVGGAINDVDANFTRISWDGEASLEAVSGIQFSARTDSTNPSYASTPKLEQLSDPNLGGTPTMLVNEGFNGTAADLPQNAFRPPLWIDFDRPQRAVGLEFGFKDMPDTPQKLFQPPGVVLTAFDAGGDALTFDVDNQQLPIQSQGVTPILQADIVSGSFTNRIGVADWQGRIASVKLEFTTDADSGKKLGFPQAVLRVWHEATLPAAVLQDVLAVDSAPGLQPAAPVPTGPVSKNLPANCDRAVVFLRGFKLSFLGPNPDAIMTLGAGFLEQVIFNPGAGGSVTLTPGAIIATGTQPGTPPWRALIYYTLLAWDSTQVELNTFLDAGCVWRGAHSPGNPANPSPPDPDMHQIFPDTLCSQQRPIPRDVEKATCGPLMGVAQGFQFFADPEQSFFIRDILLTIGDQNYDGSIARGSDAQGANSIDWPVIFHFRLDGTDTFDFSFAGTILTGRSLRVGPDQLHPDPGFSSAYFPPQAAALNATLNGERANSDTWAINWNDARNLGFAWPVVDSPGDDLNPDVPADVAFVAMEHFEFDPNGAFRDFEVELRGERYDGRLIDWQLGVGCASHSVGHAESNYALGFPSCGAVVRNARFAKPQLLTQDLEFSTGVVGVAVPCLVLGAVSNQGSAGVSIMAVERGVSPTDDLFQYVISYQASNYSLDQFAQIVPLRLRPGESLIIGGTYTAAGVLPGQVEFDRGTLAFHTTSADNPVVTVNATGIASPQYPSGYWQPAYLDFSDTPYLGSTTLTGELVSNGETVLLISGFQQTSGAAGFQFPSPPAALEPYHGVDIPFTYTNYHEPVHGGGGGPGGLPPIRYYESIVVNAVTNAGLIPILLQGAYLGHGPLPPPHIGGTGAGHGPIRPPGLNAPATQRAITRIRHLPDLRWRLDGASRRPTDQSGGTCTPV